MQHAVLSMHEGAGDLMLHRAFMRRTSSVLPAPGAPRSSTSRERTFAAATRDIFELHDVNVRGTSCQRTIA